MDQNKAETEEAITNDLIAVIWPELDAGASKDSLKAILENVFDSWEPKPQETDQLEVEKVDGDFKSYTVTWGLTLESESPAGALESAWDSMAAGNVDAWVEEAVCDCDDRSWYEPEHDSACRLTGKR